MYGKNIWFESPVQAAPTRRLNWSSGLEGLGSTNQLSLEMPNQTIQTFYGITNALNDALNSGGKPQRPYNFANYNVQSPQWGLAPNGYYTVTSFEGGWLLDSCPLNVIFGQGWAQGQLAALAQAGITPTCPQVTGGYTYATTSATPVAMQAAAPTTTTQAITALPPPPTYTPPLAPAFTPTSTPTINLSLTAPVSTSTPVYSSQAPTSPSEQQAAPDHQQQILYLQGQIEGGLKMGLSCDQIISKFNAAGVSSSDLNEAFAAAGVCSGSNLLTYAAIAVGALLLLRRK